MNSYVDVDFYEEYSGLIDSDNLEKLLAKGSELVDVLTDYHIQHDSELSYIDNFYNLNQRQQRIIKECVCELIDYQFENRESIGTVYESYSINGLSIKMNDSKLGKYNNIYISDATYNKLYSTGLIITVLK